MTDDEYLSLLDRIVKGAEYLGNPLLNPAAKAKAMKLYDSLVEEATKEKNRRKSAEE